MKLEYQQKLFLFSFFFEKKKLKKIRIFDKIMG